MTGLKIAAGVATVVMAFVAIIALINGIIGGVGGWFGFAHASLESILGYLLAPIGVGDGGGVTGVMQILPGV
ncbi:nucleoside transporter C-terminal domain-containing protein [Escherichia coli]